MEDAMERTRDLSKKAFELGYFIHRDRSLATGIVIEALDRLETVATEQGKRRSYRLLGRGRQKPRRDKVTLDRAPLLQYLVLRESELRELEQEQRAGGARLTDEDWVVRYIEHLVRITLPRNAFHVCIGISRLLYRYSTDEAIMLYDVLIQDIDGYRSADYVRARKKVLTEEVVRRFGSSMRLRTGAHGEKLFEARAPSQTLDRWVTDILRMFTPWGTSCRLSEGLDPRRSEIPGLRFDGSDPDREHGHELGRMHTVLHPPCFAGLVGALGLQAPAARLAVPIFFVQSAANEDDESGFGEPGSGSGGRYTSPLTDTERQGMDSELRLRGARRAGWKLGRLSIRVDGEEQGAIDLPMVDRARVPLPSGAGIVEVWGESADGPSRLATYLPGIGGSAMATGAGGGPSEAVAELGQGQEIRFGVASTSRQAESADEDESTVTEILEVRYRETQPVRALALAWCRWQRYSRSFGKRGYWPSNALTGVAALATAMALAVLVVFDHGQGPSHGPRLIDSTPGGALPGALPDSPSPRPGPTELGLDDPVRGPARARSGVSISQVEAIHIEVSGADARNGALFEELARLLVGTERFRTTQETAFADAVLRLSGRGGFDEPLVLVNRDGEILWQESEREPTQGADARAHRAVDSLLASIRQSP